ncbi:TonB-dependent receptor [Paraneptunicella aestuarii]|uniref:TonB-dependent receptor n=1 Tax=Paraneptunicella aestuarii TaxID=2831148 RepID=UPI001E4909C0|nr:TonB-dependent receptor [Paraneptunicella aestuarii]UAA37719.1 TonB-dependent receptor [Paraneptunicella aestuarii]
MIKTKYSKIHLMVALSLTGSLGFIGQNALAQEDAAAPPEEVIALEKIIVTSQRRVENLQDVPLSVQAMSAEGIERASIDKIEDLQLYIPNLSMTETGISTQTYIRGIGSGNNQGFEQSVVQYIDGISYARPQLTRAPFFDMQRAEVLRGPQSILFGKNAVAGALNLTTAEVSEYSEGKLMAQLGEHGIREYQAMFNFPIVEDKMFGRLSLRSYKEDGYVKNTYTDSDEPQRDDFSVRGKLHYLATDNLTINIKAEHSTFDTKGRQIEIIQDEGNPGNAFATTLGAGFGLTEAITETDLDYRRQADGGDYSKNDSTSYVLDVNYDWNQYEVRFTAAFVEYEYDDLCDCDYIAAPLFTVPMQEDYEQTSYELRIASDTAQTISWQAGLFYQEAELNFNDKILIPTGNVGSPSLSVIPTAVAALTGNVALGQSMSGTSAARDFEQDSEHFSVFSQATWNISDALKISAGLRWSTEDKTGYREINIYDTDTGNITTSPYAPIVYNNLFAIENQQLTGHELNGSRSESSLDPSINIQYYFDPDTMIYLSRTEGSKSGGFDARANTVDSFEFEDEGAISYELGLKTTFWDNRAQINIAAFQIDYDNLQVSQFDGTLGFVVSNADAEISGVEIDGRVALMEDLTLAYALSYLDHEYTDYVNGNCYYRQGSDTTNPDFQARYNPETGLCNYNGLSGQYTPKFNANLNLDYYYPLGDYNLHLNGNLAYVSEQDIHQNLDPNFKIGGYSKMDLRVSFEAEEWSISLLGRNITDKEMITYAGNSPLSGTFGADTIYAFVAPPATWTLAFNYRY